MTALAINRPRRRGACPGLSAPMPTGDGLLVRLLPIGTIPLDAFGKLCAAAREHGNGIIEITGRGNIQVRGLNAASAPRFAAAVAALAIAAADGVPILSNALAGLDPNEILDAGALAADLRHALAETSLAERLAPKVSVAIDGGSALDLDAVSADVRLRAVLSNGGGALSVGVGGDGASAIELGVTAPTHAVEAALRLLEAIARGGRNVRARDILAAEGAAPFRAALASCPALRRASTPYPQSVTKHVDGRDKPGHDGASLRADPIGLHRLRDGTQAYGVGLSFGHTDALALEQLAEAARAAGASGMRAAPGRALMIVGLTHETLPVFVAATERLEFIIRADDPRRYIIACAGAPICSSAHIAARIIAPLVAELASAHLDALFKVHISGCAKGCAHAGMAALTAVGLPAGCGLIANGSARDTPFTMIAADELPAAIARYARAAKREDNHV